jgi:hypothetical protein
MKHLQLILTASLAICTAALHAQSELYPQHFDLEEVTLTASPLKTAQDLNFQTLLNYDVDRLLTPYIRQAGLTTGDYADWEATHPSFPNWGAWDFNLDGHVGGHYLTALSLAYAACHDADTKTALKTRLDRMVSVMKDCQDVYDDNTEGLKGFIGGQPMNDAWKALYQNQNTTLRGSGKTEVPWYCQHKILAGLRDAYIYGGNTTAKDVFLKLCDWCILVTSTLSDAQMEAMLNEEHGGVNETLLDAYVLTADDKYLTAAKRFTHKTMLNGLQSLNTTFLDNKHANTQVPKYIGMERIFERDATATTYRTAAENFWQDVAVNRTLCIGGNSQNEFFKAASAANVYIDYLNGPESCNTNTMLKMSEMMSDRTHEAKYADFYEYGMWNHILSTQDPTTGQYVYFTSLRPQSYRIYSTLNESMWCCVGTGMENHSKYGHFIYTHDGTSTLYVNLFTPSTLESANFKLTQATDYPFSDESTITVRQAGTYTIAIRHPWWTTTGFKIYINNVEQSISVTQGTASYVSLNRTWTENDVIRVVVPMQLRYTPCPNYTDYIAFQYGPILLAAKTSSSSESEAEAKHLRYEASLQNEYGHEGRMDHAPDSRALKLSLTTAPLLIGDRDGQNGILSKVSTTDRAALTFTLDASRDGVNTYTWQTLTLQPFYQIHHTRYTCYWYQQTPENFANSTMAADEAAAAAIESRTLDFVNPGEQQSEAGHDTYYSNSTTGDYQNEHYRDAAAGGYVQYTLGYEDVAIESGLSVMFRFTNADAGRKATLYVDGVAVSNIMSLNGFNGANASGFYYVEFPIPAALMRDAQGNVKRNFVVRLAADKGTLAPGLYGVRLMKDYTPAALPATVTTTAGNVRTVVDGVVTGENGQDEMVHEFTYTVNNTHATTAKYWRNATTGGSYSYTLATGGNTEGVSLVVEMYGNDNSRTANIDIDGVTIVTQHIHYLRNGYLLMEYPIDPVLLEGKTKVNVKFTAVGNDYSPGTNNVYLTTGRTTAVRTKTPYNFLNTNFEKNGNDGNISSMTYNDGAIQITSGGGNNSLNMRMKTSTKDTYSIMPTQYLLLVKGQSISTNAALWWLMGCNHGASDQPTYTLADGSDQYLVWDLRKIANFNDAEKNARFFGVSEVPVTTSNGEAYSLLCMGLTSSANDGSATISDIGFYSPEQLVDKYSVLSSTVKSLKTSLATDSVFVYGDYQYHVQDASTLKLTRMLSTGTSVSNAPATLFGYTVDKAVAQNLETILNNGGEATSLIQNADCNSGTGWTTNSGTDAGTWGGQNWRGTGSGDDKYLDVGGNSYVQQTLNNMPAGYYKLVAALRCESYGTRVYNRIAPRLNTTVGGAVWGIHYGSTGASMINAQGVQMPANSSFVGYGAENTRGWAWGSVTAQLTDEGDLTIRFDITDGGKGGWKCIDDVHLYYSATADGFYQITSTNHDVPADGKVVTCDIVLDNPNTIINSTAPVTTASGATLNNNLVGGTVANLVLFDGHEFSADADFTATAATLYRSVEANGFATICAPFAISGATGTFYQPASLTEGTLNFASADDRLPGGAYLYKATSDVSAFTGSGTVAASPANNGTGARMIGTYTTIAAVPEGSYVLSGTKLYKVDTEVSAAPFRAYFDVPEAGEARLAIGFDDETNGIHDATDATQTQHQQAYDLQGRRIQRPTKGLYIVGGKILSSKSR